LALRPSASASALRSFRPKSSASRIAVTAAGSDILYNRVEWCIHPVGHAYVGTRLKEGGPTNAATSNNLAYSGSWVRVFPERKQIKLARLITRES
jgi:hypothetical protein